MAAEMTSVTNDSASSSGEYDREIAFARMFGLRRRFRERRQYSSRDDSIKASTNLESSKGGSPGGSSGGDMIGGEK
jgi:hypothetical protein